jgi:hypothetical protein
VYAIVPTEIGDEWRWLEWYERKFVERRRRRAAVYRVRECGEEGEGREQSLLAGASLPMLTLGLISGGIILALVL